MRELTLSELSVVSGATSKRELIGKVAGEIAKGEIASNIFKYGAKALDNIYSAGSNIDWSKIKMPSSIYSDGADYDGTSYDSSSKKSKQSSKQQNPMTSVHTLGSD